MSIQEKSQFDDMDTYYNKIVEKYNKERSFMSDIARAAIRFLRTLLYSSITMIFIDIAIQKLSLETSAITVLTVSRLLS